MKIGLFFICKHIFKYPINTYYVLKKLIIVDNPVKVNDLLCKNRLILLLKNIWNEYKKSLNIKFII